ncbi:hypothetical protein ABTY22_10975, partial [Escherichia coli]
SGVKIAEGMKKTAPDGAVSGMPAIRETGPGKNLQAITVSTLNMCQTLAQHCFGKSLPSFLRDNMTNLS